VLAFLLPNTDTDTHQVMKTAILLLCLVALMLCATISARHVETPPPRTFEEEEASIYEEMQDAEQAWQDNEPSQWYGFNPASPPRWNSEDAERLQTMFGGVRSQPPKGPRRWNVGHDKIDTIMNNCVPYDDYRTCTQKYFWDGLCKWNALGFCGLNTTTCNGLVLQQGLMRGEVTITLHPCMGFTHFIH
jgi:hypothetical protein